MKANLTRANLFDAKLTGANLTMARWENATTWPRGLGDKIHAASEARENGFRIGLVWPQVRRGTPSSGLNPRGNT